MSECEHKYRVACRRGGASPVRLRLAAAVLFLLPAAARGAEAPRKLDPAAWGGDHVGKPVPDFVTGDECLFCHREDVGPRWSSNRHNRTIREAAAGDVALRALGKIPPLRPSAGEVELLLGESRQVRFLRSAGHGKLALLSTAWTPGEDGRPGKVESSGPPRWDQETFGQACAGCHATGVDSASLTFRSLPIDCYACHGQVHPEHSEDARQALLSPRRKDTARVVTSICAQCHVRSGRSRSSGRPYPDNFVAGDNLFRDFAVDFSREALSDLSPADRHVLENVRDVVVHGKKDITCLHCHDIHRQSARKHRRVEETDYCLHCHYRDGPRSRRRPFGSYSDTCAVGPSGETTGKEAK